MNTEQSGDGMSQVLQIFTKKNYWAELHVDLVMALKGV